ncbi:MAG: hypothetical protein R3D52_09750 [Xanthobacteraceae bacterium]
MNKEQAFHAAVGRFVISWGDMENGLDFLALLIRRHFPVRRHQKAPQKLCEKIDFLKKQVDSLADVNECANLLDQIKTLAKTRHDLIHGAAIIWRFDRNKPAKVTFDRFFSARRQPDRTITTEEIIEIAERVGCLGDRVWDMVDGIVAASQFQLPQSN